MDWDKLRIFHAVADAGSLTHAGDQLHLSQSAISRQIRALEDALHATLFHRHARGLILTEQGELLFDATRAMMRRLDAATARIRDSEEEVFGELRVTTTIGFGTLWLAPRLSKLFEKYPDLNIDLMLEEHVLDLPMREADVAIRMKEPSQADLIRKRLMTVHMCLYASQEYLDKHGIPSDPGDLTKHRLICQNPRSAQVGAGATLVQELVAHGIPSLLTVNNYYGVLQGGPASQSRYRCPAQLFESRLSTAGARPAQPAIKSKFRYFSPIRRNCGNPSASPPSATLSRKRSSSTEKKFKINKIADVSGNLKVSYACNT